MIINILYVQISIAKYSDMTDLAHDQKKCSIATTGLTKMQLNMTNNYQFMDDLNMYPAMLAVDSAISAETPPLRILKGCNHPDHADVAVPVATVARRRWGLR